METLKCIWQESGGAMYPDWLGEWFWWKKSEKKVRAEKPKKRKRKKKGKYTLAAKGVLT